MFFYRTLNRTLKTKVDLVYVLGIVASSNYVFEKLNPLSCTHDNWVKCYAAFFGCSILWPIGIPLLYTEKVQKFIKD